MNNIKVFFFLTLLLGVVSCGVNEKEKSLNNIEVTPVFDNVSSANPATKDDEIINTSLKLGEEDYFSIKDNELYFQ